MKKGTKTLLSLLLVLTLVNQTVYATDGGKNEENSKEPEITENEGTGISENNDISVLSSENSVVSDGSKMYDSLYEALENAATGSTITLLNDADLIQGVNIIDKAFILDLNGHTITLSASENEKNAVVDLSGSAQLRILGNGKITFDDSYLNYNSIGYIFRLADHSKLVIENGIFHAGLTCVQAGDDAIAEIQGGQFSAEAKYDNTYWLLNLIDNSNAKIEVTGGSFENFDPSNSQTENPVANFVANGYCVSQENQSYTVSKGAVQAEGNYYANLVDAVEAVAHSSDQSGEIKLLQDLEGNGIGLFNKDNEIGVDITIDFNGFTYTCTGGAVGSSGTENQAFHLEKGNKVVLKNGTLRANTSNVTMMIQNYCDLTLENMTVDATQGSNAVGYVVSNNFGSLTLKGNTNIVAKSDGVAFDVYYWPSNGYQDGVKVTVDQTMTGTITGTIECGSDNTASETDAKEKAKLEIQAGTFYGTISTSASVPSISVIGGTFSSNVEQYVAEGYASYPVEGNYVVRPYSNVSISTTEETLEQYEEQTIAVTGSLQAYDSIVWKSDDDNVATVDENGKVTAVYPGTANITARLAVNDKKIGSIAVTVTANQELGVVTDVVQGETVTKIHSSANEVIEISDLQDTSIALESSAESLAQDDSIITERAKAQSKMELVENNILADSEEFKIVVQPYIDIAVENYSGEESAQQTLTFDITPKYNLVATAVTTELEALVTEGENQNAVILEGHAGILEVSDSIKMTIPVGNLIDPNQSLDESDFLIIHEHEGENYFYPVQSIDGQSLSFVNPNGFSTFHVIKDSREAKINFSNGIAAQTYKVSNVGAKFQVPALASGTVFDGWKYNGKIYTSLTKELFDLIAGNEVTLEAATHQDIPSKPVQSTDNNGNSMTYVVPNTADKGK